MTSELILKSQAVSIWWLEMMFVKYLRSKARDGSLEVDNQSILCYILQ